MKKIMLLAIVLTAARFISNAQVYFTKNGTVSFFSSAPLEDIKADNNQAISVINLATGEIQFSILNTAFHFKKALMEEHFNADYIESARYPKSTFKGTITNLSNINFNTDGEYNASVSGNLSIHGVSRTIAATGSITVRSGNITAFSTFKIRVKDYNINIPASVRNNIAEYIELTVNCNYGKKG